MRFYLIAFFLLVVIPISSYAQESSTVLSKDILDEYNTIPLANLDGWVFHEGHDPSWAKENFDVSNWQLLNPTQLSPEMADEDRKIEGWFRIRITIDESLADDKYYLSRELWSATDIYINGTKIGSFGNTGANGGPFKEFNPESKFIIPLELKSKKEYVLAIHFVNQGHPLILRDYRLKPSNTSRLINLHQSDFYKENANELKQHYIWSSITISITALLMIFFWVLVFQNRKEHLFRTIALLSGIVFIHALFSFFNGLFEVNYMGKIAVGFIMSMAAAFVVSVDLIVVEKIVGKRIPYLSGVILILFPPASFIAHTYANSIPFGIVNTIFLLYFTYLVLTNRKTSSREQIAVIIGTIVNVVTLMIALGILKYYPATSMGVIYSLMAIYFLAIPVSLLVYMAFRFNRMLREIKTKAKELIQISEEKKQIIADQNIELENQVENRTKELNQSLEDLKDTQSQLIHSEKMASLGELTAGIAHEIQNPLNFVNNFSEVSEEMIEELKEEVDTGNLNEVKEIAGDLKDNISKIHHHGERASSIVKGMLQHSRTGTGEKELTDLNAMADEYLRLAYHGLRAKDKSFNADFKLDLDESLPKIEVVPQDIGRVLLNLINNAFYAVRETKNPVVSVKTEASPLSEGGLRGVHVSVSDNGPGIPDEIKEKIFQPFFTTKASGEGTGLGLSMSYDIVTKGHGGKLQLASKKDRGCEFVIILPG